MALNNLTVPTDDADEFQRILDAAYKKYQDSIENLTDAATDEIETAINRHDMALKEIVREYVADASQLAKDYHHLLRQAWGEYSDTEFPQFADDGLVDFDRVLWQTVHGVANTDYPGLKFRDVQSGSNKFGVTMDDLWPSMDNVDDAQQFVGDVISAALRAQIQRSIRRDPTKPSWARVPQGKSCAFCTMLASRGFAYTSEEAAGGEGNKYHDDCHCRVVPSWGKQTLAGYDPDKYKELYESAKRMADDADESTASRNVLTWMREQFTHDLTDGSTLDPELRIPRGSDLYKTLGRKHALRVDMMLNASKHPDSARLWARYAKDYLILDRNFGGTPHFSPVQGGIFLDLEKIYTGDDAHRPYQNLFHETAHMLDQLLGGAVPYSYQQMFGTSIRNEGRRLLEREKNSNEIDDDDAMRNIAIRINGIAAKTDRNVEDMLQVALGDDYPGLVGHPKKYFSDFMHACAEPWAEIMDAQLANPKAYELIEQYFPQSVTIFNTMVKEMLA